MSRKKYGLIIFHLSFTFTYLIWLIIQPYVQEILTRKSQIALYEMVTEREGLYQALSAEDQTLLSEGYTSAIGQPPPSLLRQVGCQFFVKTPPFAIAWLFFSLFICILLLFSIEGSIIATWLLPLLVVGYAYFLFDSPPSEKESLFPSEEYVLTRYIHSADNKAMGGRERLLLGWHRYLIAEWGNEIPSDDQQVFKRQVDKALFVFNVARLKWILEGKGDEVILAGFTTPPSLFQIAIYLMWNLFFAWFINRKEKNASIEAQSIQTSSL